MIRTLFVAGAVMIVALIATGCDGLRPGPQAGAAASDPGNTPAGRSAEPAPPLERDEWGMSHGNGVTDPGAAITGGLRPLARYPFDTFVSAGPVLWADAVLVGTASGEVVSMSVHGRGVHWTTAFALPVSALASSPRGIFVAVGPRLHALHPRSGRIAWTVDLPSEAVTGLTLTEAALHVGLESLEVAAFALYDGSLLWRTPIGERPVDRLVEADAVLYVAGDAGTLVAIDASNGAGLWTHEMSAQPAGAPVVREDGIAAVAVDGTVTLVDHEGDAESWNAGVSPVLVPPVVHDDTIVVADGAGRIRAYSSDGSPRWRRDLPAHLAGTPLQVADILVAADARGGVVAIDLRTGTETSRLVFGSALTGDAAVYDGRVYWALRDGSVRAIGLDGALGDLPRFTAEGTWAIPENGTFRLVDEQVSLRMRSQRDAVFEILVASTPAQELEIRVETDDGRLIASNEGWAGAGSVRAVLGAGVSYQLIVGQSAPTRDLILTVDIEQLQ